MSDTEKPTCKLIGTDGNVFALIGAASKTLERAGLPDKVKEMRERVYLAEDYGDALNIIGEYVDIE
jgi:hypothetical protein